MIGPQPTARRIPPPGGHSIPYETDVRYRPRPAPRPIQSSIELSDAPKIESGHGYAQFPLDSVAEPQLPSL